MGNETMQRHMEKDYTQNHHIFHEHVKAALCNMYMLQFHVIVGKLKQRMEETERVSDCGYTFEPEDIEQINKDTYDLTHKAVQLVDNCLEKGQL